MSNVDMAAESSEPFLSRYSSDEADLQKEFGQTTSRFSHRRLWMHNLILHGVLILVYTLVTALVLKAYTGKTCKSPQHTHADAIAVAFKEQEVVFHNLSQTPFAGDKPVEDVEKAWKGLMEPMNMRFTKAELERVHQASVEMPENGGYMGWFGVFHQLHCVKMLHHAFNRARQCNSTEEDSKKDKGHVDHCIELLRQSAVCRPDTSLTTFIWHPSTALPMFNVSESVHTCVNWDAFMEESRYRVIDRMELDRLKNPLLA
ncbi:hypothetical protein HBI71_219830 [Parastagonospora nodorum]|nr:hypothetical protein HBI71_219830 [Parastagonospora nodorum]